MNTNCCLTLSIYEPCLHCLLHSLSSTVYRSIYNDVQKSYKGWKFCTLEQLQKNLFRKCGKCFSVKTKFVWFRHENCRKSEKPKQTMDNDIMFTEEAYICTAGEDINVYICKTIFVYCRAVHKNSHNVRFHSRILQRSAKHRLFWELNRVCYIMTQPTVLLGGPSPDPPITR